MIKTEVEPSQLFETDLEEGDDPLLLDRLYLYSYSLDYCIINYRSETEDRNLGFHFVFILFLRNELKL